MRNLFIVFVLISSILSLNLYGQAADSLNPKKNFSQRVKDKHKRNLELYKAKKLKKKQLDIKRHQVHDTTRLNIIKIEPFLYVVGVINASYERKIGRAISLESRIDYIYKELLPSSLSCDELLVPFLDANYSIMPVKGFSVSIGPKLFLKGHKAMSGIYIQPLLMYKNYISNKYVFSRCGGQDEIQKKISIVGFKFLMGRQIIKKNNITVDLYIGLGARIKYYTTITSYSISYVFLDEYYYDYDNFTEDFTVRTAYDRVFQPFTFHIGIKIGFAF